MHRLFLVALSSLICFIASPAFAADASADAVSAARKYLDQMKAGDVKRAVAECWDADALLTGSFGLMYLDLPDVERKRAQAAFADFLAAPFANERLAQLFKSIDVKEATPTAISETVVSVRLQLAGDGGRFNAVNILLLERRGDAWRITDQRQGEQPSIRASLALTYVGTAKGPADSIPVVLEQVASETRRQMSGK
jgi:hypothetical protein